MPDDITNRQSGMNFQVASRCPGKVSVILKRRDGGPGTAYTVQSLTIEESRQLRRLLEEAEVAAAPPPSKAERIRHAIRSVADRERRQYTSTEFQILGILSEYGDL